MTLHFSRARLLMTFTAVCTLSATAVLAQSRSPRVRFDEMDVNRDGIITRSEWRGSDHDFRVHDVNGDGVVTWREMTPNGRSVDRYGDRDQQSARDQENARARESRAAESNQPGRDTSRAFEAGRQRGQEEGLARRGQGARHHLRSSKTFIGLRSDSSRVSPRCSSARSSSAVCICRVGSGTTRRPPGARAIARSTTSSPCW